jgi:hypothetical protein
MVTFHEAIPEKLLPWILEQKIFWVATAPLTPEGHINVSPKGVAGTFHIINPNKVWYEDLSGSGKFDVPFSRNKIIDTLLKASRQLLTYVRTGG